jgi:DNA polymerase elongation subunit (family B)
LVSSCVGWLFHVSIEQNKAILWIKTEDKKVLRLIDSYQPFFYVLPKNEYDGTCLYQLLSQQPIVERVVWESKSTNLFEEYSKHKLFSVTLESAHSYTSLVRKLEKDYRVKQLFNTDLSLVQQYLFYKLKIEPTSKVKAEYDDSKLVSLARMDDENKIDLPHFSTLYIDVQTPSGKINPEESIAIIRARYEGEPCLQNQNAETLFDDKEEKDILQRFCNYVHYKDPDIIISVSDHHSDRVLDYLFARTQKLGLDLHLGRENVVAISASLKHPGLQWIKGRLSLNNYSALYNYGFAGLIERCRFSFLTLDLTSKNGMNRLIDSRNCFELIERGFVIPLRDKQSNHEHVRTLEDLVAKDKGGMIISPQTGLHENVIVLDYDSEYANLIVNHNLSYETISKNDENVNRSQKIKGLLPTVVEKFLNRRLHFKEMLKGLSEENQEYHWCQQRIDSLKNMLVCLYGTSGSLWNRLGNVLVFEEINKLSREVLLKTKDIVQKLGYEVIYADTDSVFIKDNRTAVIMNGYTKVIDTLRKEIGLPISLENNFKFLVLLPLEAIEMIEALKQYYGITHDGELVIRGIEARRHDTPNFIKKLQTELLYTLFDCNNLDEVVTKGYENALLLVTEAIDRIMVGGDDITQEDLVISKLLRQNIEKYRSLFPHVCAAIQSRTDKDSFPSKGDNIKYIYIDAQHSNPLCRVTPVKDIEKKNLKYDREKYREMVLDAAQSVLGYFGFDRTDYGDKRKSIPAKWRWLQELRKQREKDVQTELT